MGWLVLTVVLIVPGCLAWYYFNYFQWRHFEAPSHPIAFQPPEYLARIEPGHDTFTDTNKSPISTFSADVDTASYTNVRQRLMSGRLPTPDEVRVEEMVNYFRYELPEPADKESCYLTMEVSECPWSENLLLRLAVKTRELPPEERPQQNLVFLIDVSGSMSSPAKLPLLKESLRFLTNSLRPEDQIAIVVYAGASGLALPATRGSQKHQIQNALAKLEAGGSTNGESGIHLAYEIAESFESSADGQKRVILATDGDFNVGVSDVRGLKALIEKKRENGVFLSVLGFGNDHNDLLMEALADHGNGNYATIHNLMDAKKALIEEAGSTLFTVAKDVKLQVSFEPDLISNYRLIGYKNRRLNTEDFADDRKDAGEVGAGHCVTALYEIVPTTQGRVLAELATETTLATLRLRYKEPQSDQSSVVEQAILSPAGASASDDQQWAAAVAGLGLLLDGTLSSEQLSFKTIRELIAPRLTVEPDQYEQDFNRLLEKAEGLLL